MADIEKVITHLQIIKTWSEFAHERDLQFFTAKHLEDIAQWADDALELLKEQNQRIWELLCEQEGQPQIVRCKDCKHGRQYDTNAVDCEYRELATEPDWFCADGKRR